MKAKCRVLPEKRRVPVNVEGLFLYSGRIILSALGGVVGSTGRLGLTHIHVDTMYNIRN